MSDDIINMFEDDFEKEFASNLEKADGGILKTVSELARAIAAKEAQVADLDRQLKDAKKELLKLTDEDLPASMAEMGLASFTLDDGSQIDVKPTYGASILVDNRPKAYEWLRDNGYDATTSSRTMSACPLAVARTIWPTHLRRWQRRKGMYRNRIHLSTRVL
jgi:hypothetical protein